MTKSQRLIAGARFNLATWRYLGDVLRPAVHS